MNGKTLGILLAATVIVVAAAVVAYSRRTPEIVGDDTSATLLFAGLGERVNDVAVLSIRGAEQSFEIARDEAGWSLADRGGYPARFDKVKGAIMGLSGLETVEKKTSKPELYERIGVQDPGQPDAESILLTLRDEAGGELAALVVGDRGTGADRRYVRRAGEAQAWLVEGDLNVDARLTSWIDASIMSVSRTRVQSASVTHPDGECVSVHRDDESQRNFAVADIPPDREPNSEAAGNAVANALSSLRLEDVAAADSKAFDPDRMITYEARTFDGLVVTAELEPDETGEGAWARFHAAYEAPPAADDAQPDAGDPEAADPAAGAETVPEAAGLDSDESEGASGDEEIAVEEQEEDPGAAIEAEVEELNGRLSRWVFRLASHAAGSLTKRMADLTRQIEGLEAEAPAATQPEVPPADAPPSDPSDPVDHDGSPPGPADEPGGSPPATDPPPGGSDPG